MRLIESRRADLSIGQDTFKIMNRFHHFGHICTLRNSNKWDLSLTMVSSENDFVLINACKKIRSSIIAGYPIEQKRALDFSEEA